MQCPNVAPRPELLRSSRAGAESGTEQDIKLEDAVKLDIWSFGASVYECVTGLALVQHSYDVATDQGEERLLKWNGLQSAEDAQIRKLHEGQDTTGLLDFLHWTLAPDPAERPTSMEVVLNHAFFQPGKGSMREHFVIDRIRQLLPASDQDKIGRKCGCIMVSYCWANTTFVLDRLCLALAPTCQGMWLDRLGGDQGMGEWTRDSMVKGVANADVIIAVVSPQYVKSKNCGFEMSLAAKYNKTIIPIKLGVPFDEWPPRRIGETPMTNQFADPKTGDMKLFVDFEDMTQFDVRFERELKPRLLLPATVAKQRWNGLTKLIDGVATFATPENKSQLDTTTRGSSPAPPNPESPAGLDAEINAILGPKPTMFVQQDLEPLKAHVPPLTSKPLAGDMYKPVPEASSPCALQGAQSLPESGGDDLTTRLEAADAGDVMQLPCQPMLSTAMSLRSPPKIPDNPRPTVLQDTDGDDSLDPELDELGPTFEHETVFPTIPTMPSSLPGIRVPMSLKRGHKVAPLP